MAGGIAAGLQECLRHVILTLLAVYVQTFMLAQVGFFYARLLWQGRRECSPPPVTVPATADVDLASCLLSCVVMVRNEAAHIGLVLRGLSAASAPGLLEVVLVDSGSTDGTIDIVKQEAADCSFRLVHTASSGGRGAALDAGTTAASGEVIFVLHGDSVPPPGFDAMIRAGLACPGVLATAFRFELRREELAEALPGAGVMEFSVNVRSSLLQLPFGDQGLAIAKWRLQSYGGWGGKAYPIMEEFQLVQRMRADGARGRGYIKNLTAPVRCSPRRWARLGVWRVNLVNQLVMIWYRFGASPQQLFDFYYGVRADHVPWWLRTLTAPLLSK